MKVIATLKNWMKVQVENIFFQEKFIIWEWAEETTWEPQEQITMFHDIDELKINK